METLDDSQVMNITSGNPDVDQIFGGFCDTKEPKGQVYTSTIGDFQGRFSGLPGEKVINRGGGATITLDGAKITTYPGGWLSTRKPDWVITNKNSKRETIKGSR
ncbi:hypothetical protein L1787_04475 [Acuticoccus sp. M5D2P5]|uniref:hypothetical protein n=1 Tax=Acuticoccus kalidii TaxID=2910977 RepID=UPI001F362C0A|nr:hypothetical protein [Acuticoccus kalidii]MCF3932672.1 hypothetical protein [Acuticoccus kalidii]